MNIFRILGTRFGQARACPSIHWALYIDANKRLNKSGSVPPRLHPHTASENEIFTCRALSYLKGAFCTDLGPQSCSGISFKSQALYMIVYATRYLGIVPSIFPRQYKSPATSNKEPPHPPPPSASSTTLSPPSNYQPLPRHLLDPHNRLPLQHHLQTPLPVRPILHPLPNANRLPPDPRPQHRHLQSRIPPLCLRHPRNPLPLPLRARRDAVGVQHLAGERGDIAAVVYVAEDGGSGDDHDALSVRAGGVQGAVYPELAVAVFWGGVCGSDSVGGWGGADGVV